MKVSFLGLGTMGFPMAGHVSRAGHEVVVYNRTQSKAQAWLEAYQGSQALTPMAAAQSADLVLTCVGNDDDLRQLYLGEQGVLSGARAGTLFVDHTTASAEVARELAQAAQAKGCEFIDAPVSGGEAGAVNGVLTVMIGGSQTAIDRALPVLECFAKACTRMGEVGAGQLSKMVNQVLVGGILTGLSEGIRFAEKAGLDIPTLVETLKYGAAGSWQLENRGENMAQDKFDYGFAIEWMCKDLGMAIAQAEQMGLKLPYTEVINADYHELVKQGYGRCDTSVLIKALYNK
ncbi:NAD(P)-dependent oxidoreductase [Marinomonas aquimarina]|nr:NAD(P)-dependent oxidoreductase [Marinomonas aquimarina]